MKILWVESHDFSQAEKDITTCKAKQIHKMTPIFTQNNNLSENSCHFCEFAQFKGQLISKCPFGTIVSTKIPTKKFDNFCPRIWKVGKSTK